MGADGSGDTAYRMHQGDVAGWPRSYKCLRCSSIRMWHPCAKSFTSSVVADWPHGIASEVNDIPPPAPCR